MPTMPKRPGDAVLCRDGSVKVGGAYVGFWWVDGNDLYNFARTRPANTESGGGEIASIFRHDLKSHIPVYLASDE